MLQSAVRFRRRWELEAQMGLRTPVDLPVFAIELQLHAVTG